jgi:hypothetical protein
MRPCLLTLFALPFVISAQPEPSAAERERVLQTAREFARNYIERLPDFICLRVTQHHARPANGEWKFQVKVAEELSYYKRQEHARVVAVNDAPAKKLPHPAVGRLVYSGGDFGEFLQEVFREQSRAAFNWKGWETLRGKRAWVFSYRMPEGYEIRDCHGIVFSLGVCKTSHFPYHGLVYVAEDGLTIMRLTVDPEKSTAEQQETRSIDYDRVTIAGADYLLPIADTFERQIAKTDYRNESVYRDYRKFAADSTIKIAPDSDR